jgi:hypothetical protein
MRARALLKKNNLIQKLSLQCFLPVLATFALYLIIPQSIQAQEPDEYYEISVNLEIPRIGGTEIEAVIYEREIYLSVNQLFEFLKINKSLSQDLNSIKGFFINKNQTYKIDRSDNSIVYGKQKTSLKEGDLIKTEFDLYLKAEHFGTVFGFDCIFSFRTLSVRIETQLDLPLIREMKQLQIRKNLNRITGEQVADTTFEREYPRFKFGTADWSAISSQEIDGKSNTRLNLSLGAMIAGGEATASLNYDDRIPFSEKQQFYEWKYVNNDQSLLKQVKIGKIRDGTVSTIYNPIVGAQITNTPTTFRRSFGTYKISDRTEPGWIVELYVNNVLVDYVTADASGFFSFDVPLVYGNTSVHLKFFGPWGEESSREQNINIPYNFIPKKEFEYTLSMGFIEDSSFSKFGRASLNYGLSNRITMGAGVEYISYLSTNPAMPFVSSSIRVSNNLMITGEYVHRVKAGGALTYRLPSNIQLDLKYIQYDANQKAINYSYLEERKATLSLPLKIGKFSAYNRFSLNQLILPFSKYTTGDWMFATSLWGVNTNLSTYAIFIDNTDPYIYNNLSLAFRLPARITIMPQVQYSLTENELLTAKVRIEKHLMANAYMNLSFEKDLRRNITMAEFGFRYNFAFAQTGASVRSSDKTTSLVEYARGSLINDSKNKYFKAENRPNVGRGGIIIVPFLDNNSNGIRDYGEVAAPGLKLRANGGKVDRTEMDTTIAILGLEPYTSCYIELDPNSFDNIAWRLSYENISVMVDPNVIKTVNIPVEVVGEASGFVRIARDYEVKGLGRIIMNFFSQDGSKVKSVLSESDGYYSYFGFAAGSYFVRPDTAQLSRLGMISAPDTINFEIESSFEGDYVSGLDFLLRMKSDPLASATATIERDTSYMIIHEIVEELMTITEDGWAIQLGAFSVKANADRLKKRLEGMLGKDAEIVIEGGFHKVRILEIKDREEIDRHLAVLNENGFMEFWVVRLIAMQQQRVLREIEDTIFTIIERVVDPGAPEAIAPLSIKIGSFNRESLARAIMDKLRITINKDLRVIEENGYYKILASDFKDIEELDKTMTSLGIQGIRDIEIAPEAEVGPDVVERLVVDSLKTKDVIIPVNELDTDLMKETLKINEPKVSLLVGNYSRRTKAQKAKRKIESKLNLSVKIIEQWDMYRVVVIGFFTVEETYRYYPELAGIGYDVISIIDESEK